jgi:AcrR family transcriptional regulator
MAKRPLQQQFEAQGDPRHAARATRSAGRKMRSLLLDAASPMFRERGLSGTAISDIAAAVNAFPSQITYYFRTKEALFVECACRDLLYLARATEQAALQAQTPGDYTRALAETVTASAPSSACIARARAPMRARWRAMAGAPCARRTKVRGGSGPSLSASSSKATPWAVRRTNFAPR